MKRESQNAGGRLDASFHLKRDARTFCGGKKRGQAMCGISHGTFYQRISVLELIHTFSPFFSQINPMERVFMT